MHECKAYAEKLKEIPIHMFIVWVLWLIHTKMGNTITYGEWKKSFRIPKPMQKCATGAAAGRNARNKPKMATKKDIETSFNVLHHYFTVGFYLSILFYYQKTWVNASGEADMTSQERFIIGFPCLACWKIPCFCCHPMTQGHLYTPSMVPIMWKCPSKPWFLRGVFNKNGGRDFR